MFMSIKPKFNYIQRSDRNIPYHGSKMGLDWNVRVKYRNVLVVLRTNSSVQITFFFFFFDWL